MEQEIQAEIRLEDIVNTRTIRDMDAVHAIGKGCGMKIALAEFTERDGFPRLARVVLVNWDFDKHSTEWQVNVN